MLRNFLEFNSVPFALPQSPNTYGSVVWSPTGEKLALVKEDGSVWQVDYPSLENLEQLTPSLPDVSDLKWSPDGNSVSFISGSGIHIVEANK